MINKSRELTKEILDDLSIRFILNSPEFITLIPEEYYFILEEAYWFALDFLKIPEMPLHLFVQTILTHNGIKLNASIDYLNFKKYKQDIKVYGTMIFNPELTHCLLVQQKGASTAIAFPKGKKSKNETGIECAIRETKEEVGYDVRPGISNLNITIFEKITLFFVFNVSMDVKFKTETREEIGNIFWFDLKNVWKIKQKKEYRIFYMAYTKASKIIDDLRRNRFKFDNNKVFESIKTE